MKKILLVSITLFLCACAHHPLDCATNFVPHDDCLPGTAGYESSQKRSQYTAELAMKMIQEKQQTDDEVCRSYGLKFGTHDYAECREHREALKSQEAISQETNQQNANIARQNEQATVAMQLLSKTNQPITLPSLSQSRAVNCVNNGLYTNCRMSP